MLSEIFSINRFFGQIIITTHSPNILLSDYKQITRFFKDSNDDIAVRNGQEISLDQNLEKHLLKNMPYIKEGFFKMHNLLRATQIGAFSIFAQKLKIDLDDCGISVVKAGSAIQYLP